MANLLVCCVIIFVCVVAQLTADSLLTWTTTDELENHISPEDLREFLNLHNPNLSTTTPSSQSAEGQALAETDIDDKKTVPDLVDCFGLGSFTRQLLSVFNMKPDSSEKINTHFYFTSKQAPLRVQVYPGAQFGLEWVDFKPTRKTVMIVHGFMSHSNASWVRDMTKAFLQWADVNVIAVDWSAGGNTWKYWRAVANTRRVGADVTDFLRQLKAATGARFKDFHLVGHSLGAHICSYVSYHLGGVARITGLDPAQPCFRTTDASERLDATDADFVDIVHTNGRLLQKIGFGLPEPAGHADFYPNGGMKQPGCHNETGYLWKLLPISPAKLQQAICSHGRAYLLFTESLVNNNCTFRAHSWNLTYEGVNSSLVAACDRRRGACSEMGIRAVGGDGLPRASGPYFVLTTEHPPYCPSETERRHPRPDLLRDLQRGFRLNQMQRTPPSTTVTPAYADPLAEDKEDVTTTTKASWYKFWRGQHRSEEKIAF